MHIQDREQCNWIRERIETPVQYKFSAEDKIVLLDRLTWATSFESFLNVKVTSLISLFYSVLFSSVLFYLFILLSSLEMYSNDYSIPFHSISILFNSSSILLSSLEMYLI
jgi:hypothetical protein